MQEIQVNYTIATGSEPDVKIASTNCHNSHVLLRNYELDTTGQAERDELEQVRSDITMYEGLIGFTKTLLNSQQLVTTDADGRATLLSPKPSPPPPPPPVATVALNAPMHPPAPPETVSGRALIARYEDLVVENEAREGQLVLALDECLVKDRAAGTVCGLTSNESPYPWLAIDGVKCRGHDTLSTREGDYCGCAQRVPHMLPLAPPHPNPNPNQIGNPTSIRWRPTLTCARSCSRWGPFASGKPTKFIIAHQTRRARNAAGLPTSST